MTSGPQPAGAGEVRDDFEDVKPTIARPRLIVSIEGEEKCGKNHFAFTAPGPIYLLTCDPTGTEQMVDKFVAGFETPDFKYPARSIKKVSFQIDGVDAASMDAKQMQRVAQPLWYKFVANYRTALQKARTIVWDTADEFWELLRLAQFGELTPKLNKGEMGNLYGEINGMYEGLVKECFASPVNMIFIHRVKDEYVNNNRTGVRKRAGYKDMYYLTQLNLRAHKVQKLGGGAEFNVQVLDCRRNPDLENSVWPNDFAMLARMVLPEVDPGNWE